MAEKKVYLITGSIATLDDLTEEERIKLFSSIKHDSEIVELSENVFWCSDIETILEHYNKS